MGLTIAIMKESDGHECRVALVPEAVAKLVKNGLAVVVETGAGMEAGFTDTAYEASGAKVVAKWGKEACDIVLRVTMPGPKDKLPLGKNGVLVCFSGARTDWPHTVLGLQKLPRVSRAQALDVLSSQANLAGYASVLAAAEKLPRLMPMLMTAAGSAKPAQVLVLGVGVAGLQAIATARRLGAQVMAFDVRPEVGEQIMSLGAKPVVLDGVSTEGKGGYAGAMDEAGLKRLQGLLAPFIAKADMVISTAQVPGKAAPVLISAEAVKAMKPGSVVVDMAAGGFSRANRIKGGNCLLTVADEMVDAGGVTILGETNWPARVAGDASRFWAQNMVNLLGLLVKDGKLDFSDELIAAMKTGGA